MVADHHLHRLVLESLHAVEELPPAFGGKPVFAQKSGRHRVDADAAVHPGPSDFSAFLQIEKVRHRARRMPRSRGTADLQRSEDEHIAVMDQNVGLERFVVAAAELLRPGQIERAVDIFAVGCADEGPRAGHLDEGSGHPDMVEVTVRVQYPADVARIEAQIVQIAEQKVTAFGKSGVQKQQSVAGIEQIRRRMPAADVPQFAVYPKRRQIFFPGSLCVHLRFFLPPGRIEPARNVSCKTPRRRKRPRGGKLRNHRLRSFSLSRRCMYSSP